MKEDFFMSDVSKTMIAMLNELQDHHYIKQLVLLSHKSTNLAISVVDMPTDFHKVLTLLSDRKVFGKYEPNPQFSELVYYKLYKPALYQFSVEEYASSLSVSFEQNVIHFSKQVIQEIDKFTSDLQPLSSEEFITQLHYLNSSKIDEMDKDLKSNDYDSLRAIQKHLNKDLSKA